MQVNNDTGDNGATINMLSGEVIPAIQQTPEQVQGEHNIQSHVYMGKIIFFFLAIFLIVYWVKISLYGVPKEWWDKGYSLLIFMYAFGDAGRHATHAYQDFGYGDYWNMAGHVGGIGMDVAYIHRPCLLSIPYAGFIYWALRGRWMFSAYEDEG
jgi:hypothetical protein